jgi:hypothetical protein
LANSYPYTPGQFSGKKFAVRYGLDAEAGDFWADGQFVYVREGITLPDNPPIFEEPDDPAKFDPEPDNIGFTGTMLDLLEE